MVIIMNNKISNQKKEVPTGIMLNDKDYMTNLLSILKCMEKDMATALTEASNEKLYDEYKKIFDTTSIFQRQAYELMFKFGWYPLETASKTKIESQYKNLKKELDSIN